MIGWTIHWPSLCLGFVFGLVVVVCVEVYRERKHEGPED